MMTLITLAIFWTLIGWTGWRSPQMFRHKSRESWILDVSGLLVQGIGIPLLQVWGVSRLYAWLWPGWEHRLQLPAIAGFLLSFVAVDYLYYWNHRGLHSRWGWPIHRVHHTMTQRDVLGTSRNTLWSSLFILYLWVHGLALYGLADPTGYLIGVALSNGLDLWRHSELDVPPRWASRVGLWLILPPDHAGHHSRDRHGNFGANFKLWDRLHGTLLATPSRSPAPPTRFAAQVKDSSPHPPERETLPLPLGIELPLSLARKLLWPF